MSICDIGKGNDKPSNHFMGVEYDKWKESDDGKMMRNVVINSMRLDIDLADRWPLVQNWMRRAFEAGISIGQRRQRELISERIAQIVCDEDWYAPLGAKQKPWETDDAQAK